MEKDGKRWKKAGGRRRLATADLHNGRRFLSVLYRSAFADFHIAQANNPPKVEHKWFKQGISQFRTPM